MFARGEILMSMHKYRVIFARGRRRAARDGCGATTAGVFDCAKWPATHWWGQYIRDIADTADEASMTVGTQAKAATATGAVAASKVKTEKLLAAIHCRQDHRRDVDPRHSAQPDYRWDHQPSGQGEAN